jgi:hypothetical protein
VLDSIITLMAKDNKFTVIIDNVFGGLSPTEFFSTTPGQFQDSKAIDPDLPKDDSAIKTSGYLRPTSLAKFSASTVTGTPRWIVTNPKTENIYVYASDGKIHTVDSALTMGADVATLSTASGNGAAYYDNYAYFARNADVARYGPLNGSPSVTTTYWTSTLSLTAPSNTTYPSINGVAIPNHAMHRHTDNKLYFCDVHANNYGILNYIKTSRTSVEGDTNDSSAYNALDFGYGEYPTCLETYNTFLAVGLIEGTGTTTLQKPAKVSFWDTTSASFQQITSVELPDPLITAMRNVNGILYVFTGNASGGFRVLQFKGGYSYKEIYYSEEGGPPFQGAVDHFLNRLIWGGYVTRPSSNAIVYANGSKQGNIPMGVHKIYASTSAGSNQNVTACKYVLHSNNRQPGLIVGWKDGSSQGLDKISTTYGAATFWSETFRLGRPFQILKVFTPLAQAVAANMTLVPKIYVDDASSSTALTTINSTNYAASQRNIVQYPSSISGKHNFFLELVWSGTTLLTVALPIIIEGEYLDDSG